MKYEEILKSKYVTQMLQTGYAVDILKIGKKRGLSTFEASDILLMTEKLRSDDDYDEKFIDDVLDYLIFNLRSKSIGVYTTFILLNVLYYLELFVETKFKNSNNIISKLEQMRRMDNSITELCIFVESVVKRNILNHKDELEDITEEIIDVTVSSPSNSDSDVEHKEEIKYEVDKTDRVNNVRVI